jgi:Protein of unknown function (DUF2975)
MPSAAIASGLPNPMKVQALQKRIGWLCHLCRTLAAGYAAWTLWLVISFWQNAPLVGRRFAALSGTEPVLVSEATRIVGFSLSMLSWLMVAATCWTAWGLFTAYLDGRIFTIGSASRLRRLTLLGIGAVLVDVVSRPALVWLVTGQTPAFSRAPYYYFAPNDLVLLIFLVALFAVAHIFKVAAELADENAQIL